MQVNTVSHIINHAISEGRSMAADDSVMSLDDRLIEKFSQLSVHFDTIKKETLEKIETHPGFLSNPDALMELQKQALDYNLEVSLVSTLTRKATSAVETLLRS